MNRPVKLMALVVALQGSPLMVTYIDRETGEVVVLAKGMLNLAKSGQPANQPMLPVDRLRLKKARTILADAGGRYLPGPKPEEFPEYKAMQDFIASLDDRTVAYDLSQAIKARGAFRQFKEAITQLGRKSDWLAFRDQALKAFAKEWAAGRGLEVAG